MILDTIVAASDDMQDLLERLYPLCHKGTRIIMTKYSFLWECILSLLRVFRCPLFQHFDARMSRKDLLHFLYLSNYECITKGRHILVPFYLPFVSALCNNILALLPGVNFLCLREWMIIRPVPQELCASDYTVSIIIPCRNKRDNIEAAVVRTPEMGRKMEFIFVEGHSLFFHSR